MESREIVGLTATAVGLSAFIPYLLLLFRGQVKPHVFSWVVWGTANVVAATAQLMGGAGPGAWAIMSVGFLEFAIAKLALGRGERDITRTDVLSFVGALAAIPVWIYSQDLLTSVILITTIDALGFYPTFRKSYEQPHQESPLFFALFAASNVLSLLALETVSPITALYPAYLVVFSCALVALIWVRRSHTVLRTA